MLNPFLQAVLHVCFVCQLCARPAANEAVWETIDGAGKTTVLRHLLQNAEGLKIGCVVNDVVMLHGLPRFYFTLQDC